MRSLATVSTNFCSIFAVIIAVNILSVLNLMYSKKQLDLSKSKTIQDLKYQNSLCKFMCLIMHLKDFPSGRFDFDALTTQDLFGRVHRVVNIKTHLHHSHVVKF